MKPSWRTIDRSREVRRAVLGWRRADLAGDDTVAAARVLHPDPGPEVAPVWSALVFVFVLLALGALVGFYFMITDFRSATPASVSLAAFGLLLVLLTERLADRFSLAGTGSAGAASLAALGCLMAAALILLHDAGLRDEDTARVGLLLLACLAAAGAWRWGLWVYGVLSAGAAFVLLATFQGGRILWLVAGTALALAAGWAAERLDPAPSHRGCLEAAQAVSLAAVYLAVNSWSLESGLIESFRSSRVKPWGVVLTWIPSLAATALLPAGVILRGILARKRLLIDAGLLMAAASLVTMQHHLRLRPAWAVMAGGGAVLILASVGISRFLRRGADGERIGLTATSLGDEARRERLLPAMAAVTLSPEAREIPGRPWQGGGGGFGGGGAGGNF